jgi:hypothetical protein
MVGVGAASKEKRMYLRHTDYDPNFENVFDFSKEE